jgi:endogenous inhibitor of DNA gyrase (YacG/DUF329 family)
VSGQKGEVKAAPERCRYCRRPLAADDPQHRRFWPFCSDRCKMAELGLWFTDRYVISRRTDEVADDAGNEGPPPAKDKKTNSA